MGLIAKLDNWTLIASIALVCSMAAFAFARTWGTHRRMRASGSIALGFLCATIASLLYTLVPETAPATRFFSIVLGNTFMLAVYAFLLTGVEQIFNIRRLRLYAWTMVAVAFVLFFIFTQVHSSEAARMLVASFCTFAFRVFITAELLRRSGRRHVRSLSALMIAYAALSLFHVWRAFYRPASLGVQHWMHARGIEQLDLVATLFFFIATSQLLFLILNGELVLQLEREATHDFMTGTLNRRGTERALSAEMGRSTRFKIALSVALVDVDHFKQINDTLGHAEGDRTLRAVAGLIEDTLRAYDSVGRFGGDEFLLILPNTPPHEALKIMERVRETTASSLANRVTLSIGLTAMLAAETADSLLMRVDQALYQAKEEGRNRSCLRLPPEAEQFLAAHHHALAESPTEPAA